MKVLDYIKKDILVIDGAMGTMLQERGLALGENPEIYGYKNPDILNDIHSRYLEAGCNVLTSNTFGANSMKLGNDENLLEEVIDSAIKTAKKSIMALPENKRKNRYVAHDIGPIGEMLEPNGDITFDEAYNVFKRQIIQGTKSGADFILIETMMDLGELRAAVLAAKENSDLPVFCTMTFNEDGRSFNGCSPECMVLSLEALGIDALGVNCSLGPKMILPIVEKISKVTSLPIIVQANAGMPKMVDGKVFYDVSPDEFFEGVISFVKFGVSIVGGCCGTNPEYIKKIADNRDVLEQKRTKINNEYKTRVCTNSKFVDLESPIIVGEKINPSGQLELQNSIKNDSIEYAINLAVDQANAGADILDVNFGLPGIDEEYIMTKFIKKIQALVSTPLQIDSVDKNVVEKALRYYNGRAIVDSVNGRDESLDTILPIVKKYGACVIGLPLDENGLPKNANDRYNIAKKIVEATDKYGIRREDVLIDCLSLTIASEQNQVFETIEAIELIKQLGVKTIIGISNVSFGMPNRSAINSTFLTLALNSGLDIAILNPNDRNMMGTVDAYKALRGIDVNCMSYLNKYNDYAENEELYKDESKFKDNKDLLNGKSKEIYIEKLVIRGLKEEVGTITKDLLKENDGTYIIDNVLIPILDSLSKKFESGEIYLPHLIQSADVIKNSLDIIRVESTKERKEVKYKGKVAVATVEGDVHDIGKNIVKLMLENYGYEVIDVGKDVSAKEIEDVVVKEDIKLLGLSALMTTTVKSMEDTIKQIKKNCKGTKIFVGGAVLTEDYAEDIGADFYSSDAKSAVEIAKKIFN